MKFILKSLLIVFTVFLLIGCADNDGDVSLIPVLSNNQDCIESYLKRVGYSNVDNLKFKLMPFKIEAPIEVIGFMEIKSEKNENMEPIYNGLKFNCYPVKKSSTNLLVNDWSVLSESLNRISKSDFESKKIYLMVDVENKSYETYLNGREIKD